MGAVAAIDLRPMIPEDTETIPQAFAPLRWPGKTVDRYRQYLHEQTTGVRQMLIACCDGAFAGQVTVRWTSTYAPFRDQGIPEIQDLLVLPAFRRRGIATALMDAAETAIAARSDTAGLGVGLYAAYTPAHLLYLRRGYLPDGQGTAYQGVTVIPGATVMVDDDLTLMLTRRLR
ncbi:MAG: GNAT family N-acetyltransferase [Micromonosporaceae bacterium]|nr:GNAT family N-acetyltransferase [Micromonosporaceae bacterium]